LTFSSSSTLNTISGVWGAPTISLDDVPSGSYSVQAFMTRYSTAKRSDGSVVSVHFPCGDGAPNLGAYGSLNTAVTNFTVTDAAQTLNLVFNEVVEAEDFEGKEIGGCHQGNYADTNTTKYIKIRSDALSKFWGRDMYVGATVYLPAGYDANDTKTRYPVVYSQNHWTADEVPFASTTNFTDYWDRGTIPGNATAGTTDRETPKMILINFRHETPFYDDSYAVNTANLGPYGDALNDELIPVIDKTFNTIAEPYGRVQVGGSTGGWESIANLIFRPDLFGVCFSSYPDSLSFYRHQDIPLYTGSSAYLRDNGSAIPSIRKFVNGTQVVEATTAQENHWELTFGTNSRSFNQWDIWNAVFGVQGLNGYPLEPWNKVTGEIYEDAVQLWKPMDLTNYVVSNFNNSKNLGKALAGRVFVYVGTWDTYFLNEGVQEFQTRTNAANGGQQWANVSIIPERIHGGIYNGWDIWRFLFTLQDWVETHSPTGTSPLPANVTRSELRGNLWKDVLQHGGHAAAVARQAPPSIVGGDHCDGQGGCVFQGNPGSWDPGMLLTAQWIIGGKPVGQAMAVQQGEIIDYAPIAVNRVSSLQLQVTGTKTGYQDETRTSKGIKLRRSW
jgi:enterochelin esterase-like enzyme